MTDQAVCNKVKLKRANEAASVKYLALASAVFLATVASTSATAGEPTSYPLLCKGGGTLFSSYSSYLPDDVEVTYVFKKAPTASSPALAPGECTWLDRPLGAQEPAKIKISLKRIYPTFWKLIYDYYSSSNEVKPRVVLADASTPHRDLMVEYTDPAKGLQMMAYNAGTTLVATAIVQ